VAARISRGRFQKLQAIAPGIFGVEAARSGKGVVVRDFDGVGLESFAKPGQISYGEGGVSLFCRVKISFDANVKLLIAALEPAAAAGAEGNGLFDFSQAENRAVEFASSGFRAFRGGQLDVVDASYHGAPPSLGYRERAVLYSAHQGFSATRPSGRVLA
jgi:hypothetical protein